MLDLTDRKNCFYWQTDRNLSAEDYAQIFLKRHDVPKGELITILRNGITTIPNINKIEIQDPDKNVTRGNVNIVRKLKINNKPYVVRMHPKNVKNGYFYVEKVAHDLAIKAGLPVSKIDEVHEAANPEDMDFVLMTVLRGTTLDNHLLKDKTNEVELLYKAGTLMAQIHTIRVVGFGSFDNEIAKTKQRLIGLHGQYHDFVWAGLEENLQRLVALGVLDGTQAQNIKTVFDETKYEPLDGPRLIHNDMADWNMLTNGEAITGVLDWDECHGGDPIADLACWSTFFTMNRYQKFLNGYKSVASLPVDYEKRFHFYRLRYTISKMALRVKRYAVDKSEFVRSRIESGKDALREELAFFKSVTL